VRELNTEVERVISAPAGEIWAYRLDFLHLPEYNTAVEGIERVDDGGPDQVGATYRFDLVTGSHSTAIELRVTEAVPGRLVAIDMDGVISARERFSVSPVAGAEAGTGPCRAAIALTLLIPDGFPASGDAGLLTNGEQQVAGELDRMVELLGAGTAVASRGGHDRG
jgi:uncharacterized membrane protein